MDQFTMAFKLFSHICMGSMVLSCFDPTLMTWAGNFLHHSVAGYANVPDVLGAFTGAAAIAPAAAPAAAAAHVHVPGMVME